MSDSLIIAGVGIALGAAMFLGALNAKTPAKFSRPRDEINAQVPLGNLNVKRLYGKGVSVPFVPTDPAFLPNSVPADKSRFYGQYR